uniref:Long-chain fatty acid--CoA ligase n=1 Tax=Schlesneria paludicola TaxID=360056 RepID=A0A7C2JWV0_9PLAN
MTQGLMAALQTFARSAPERMALSSKDGAVSYAELLQRSRALAGVLRAEGIAPGDRVVLVLDNSVEFVVGYLATQVLGAIAVPWNPMSPCAALEGVFRDCTPAAALIEPRHADWLPALAQASAAFRSVGVTRGTDTHRAAGVSTWTWADRMAVSPMAEPCDHGRTDDVAAIIYTSGTTGTPKGVMLSQRNLEAIAAAGTQMLGLASEDRVGIVAPLFHLYALREVDAALRLGAAVLLPPGGVFLTSQLGFLKSAQATGLSAVPSVLAIMAEKYPAGLAALAGDLRYLTIGTAPATRALVARLRDLLPQTRIVLTYGLTECSRVCYREIVGPEDDSLGVHIGRPYPGVELELLNPSDGVGRIAVRSPMVMRGYWNRPEATAAVLQSDGTLLTPDCGWLSEQGELHLLGRLDDVINCGGHKVSPDEVEAALVSHPGVAQVAVTPLADPEGLLGQVVRAVVVPRDPALTSADLLQHAARRLEAYKVPRVIEFVEEIPSSVLGKPQRSALRRDAAPRA